MKRIFTIIVSGVLTLSTVSCWNVQIDNDPNQQNQAKMVSKQYLMAFFNGDKAKAMAISTVPFYADGDLFKDQYTYEKELGRELSRTKPRDVEISELSFHTVKDLKAFNMRIYHRLVKKGFKLDSDVYLVAAFIKINKRKDQGFLLVKKFDNGWKVVGILD